MAPTMELLPVYTAKVARLKQLMVQQRQTVDRMKIKAEEVRRVKAGNYERLKKRWEEERERDKGLTARMVGVVEGRKGLGETTIANGKAVAKAQADVEVRRVMAEPSSSSTTTATASRIERQVEHQEVYRGPETPVNAPGPSIPPTTTVVTKTVVKRKKKARQAEIE